MIGSGHLRVMLLHDSSLDVSCRIAVLSIRCIFEVKLLTSGGVAVRERELWPSLPMWDERRSHAPPGRRLKRSKKSDKCEKPRRYKRHEARKEAWEKNQESKVSQGQAKEIEKAESGVEHNEPCESGQGREALVAEESKRGQEKEEDLPEERNSEKEKKEEPLEQQAELPLENVPILLPAPPGVEAVVSDAVVGAEVPGLEKKAQISRATPSTLISSLHSSELRSPGGRRGGEKGSSQGTSSHRGDTWSKGGGETILSSFDGWETERD